MGKTSLVTRQKDTHATSSKRRARNRSLDKRGLQCFAINCNNCRNKLTKSQGISFHKFPNKKNRRDVYQEWVKACRRNVEPTEAARLCSVHFLPECLNTTLEHTQLRDGAVPTEFDIPEHLKKRKVTVEKKIRESHTDVETQDMSSSNIPDFHTYSVSVDGLLQKLRKVEDMNESLQTEIENSKARKKHFTDLILIIKQELKEKNCLTEDLEDRLSFYQEASENLSDNSVKTFNPELVEIKSEPVGEAEEEWQNGDLQDHKFVEIKCESSGDVQDHEFGDIKYTSDEKKKVGAFEIEDPLIMNEEADSSIEHHRSQNLESGSGVTRDVYGITYNMASSYFSKSTGSFCSAYGCSNNKRDNPEKSFFRFPKDQERCQIWVHCSRREDLQGKDEKYLYDNCRLCGDHFSEDMFMNSSKKKLVWNAIPKPISVTATATSRSQET